MNASLPFRVCAGVLVLFAILHTIGFLGYKPPTHEGLAVKEAMDHVTFQFGSATRTYGDLYRGFGLFVTAYLLFGAIVAWQLPSMLAASPETFRTVSFALLLTQIAGTALAWIYFAMPQAIFSVAVVACVIWGIVAARSS